MGRDVPFNPIAICDNCGAVGAYDFMGDYLCQSCVDDVVLDDDDDDQRLAELRAVPQ